MTPDEAARAEELKKQLSQLEALEKAKPLTIDLDENDSIRLENILLKERNYELEKQSFRSNFYARLVHKYDIDLASYDLVVEAQQKKIILTPK